VGAGAVDVSRHFSYYAFEGATGESVWKHTSGTFHKDLEGASDELTPQDDYRSVGVVRGYVSGGAGRRLLPPMDTQETVGVLLLCCAQFRVAKQTKG